MGSAESGECSWYEFEVNGMCCTEVTICYYPGGRRRLSAQSKRASYSTKGKKFLQDSEE